MQDDTSHISSALTLLGYDSATGLNYHNGIGLRGRYPATHGSFSGLPLDDAKSQYYGNQPGGPLATLPILSYRAESHSTLWRELTPPPPAYSYRPEPTVAPWIGRIPVPRPVHVTPDASTEFTTFFMTGLANPVDDWTFGDSRTTMKRNNWQNRSLSYPGATVEADNLTRALKRNLSDPGRYPATYVISTSIGDAQISSRGGILTPDGLSPTQPHDSHDTSDDDHSNANDTPPPQDALPGPVISSDSMMTIRPCTASYVPYYCSGPMYTATTALHPQGLVYHHSQYPLGSTSTLFVNDNSRPPTLGLGSSQIETVWGTSENERGQSGLRELHHGEIGDDGAL